VLGQVGFHFVAAGEAALDLLLDRQTALLAIKGQNLVDGVEKFLRLARADLDLRFLRGRLGWSYGRGRGRVFSRLSILNGAGIFFRLVLNLIPLRGLILCRTRHAAPEQQHTCQKRPHKPAP